MQRAELAVDRQALHREDLRPVRPPAASIRQEFTLRAVHDHRAGTALPHHTALLGAGEAQVSRSTSSSV